jgi:hypothetical protein
MRNGCLIYPNYCESGLLFVYEDIENLPERVQEFLTETRGHDLISEAPHDVCSVARYKRLQNPVGCIQISAQHNHLG